MQNEKPVEKEDNHTSWSRLSIPGIFDVGSISGKVGGHTSIGEEKKELWGEEVAKHKLPVTRYFSQNHVISSSSKPLSYDDIEAELEVRVCCSSTRTACSSH